MIFSVTIPIQSQGFCDVLDLSGSVLAALKESGLINGLVTIFAGGSTAGVTTIEFEPGAVADLKAAIERMAPVDLHYQHDARWGDGNGFSHVRAALLGPSLSIPLIGGRLALGTWQQIVLVDFDNRPRRREILVQFMGD